MSLRSPRHQSDFGHTFVPRLSALMGSGTAWKAREIKALTIGVCEV